MKLIYANILNLIYISSDVIFLINFKKLVISLINIFSSVDVILVILDFYIPPSIFSIKIKGA